MSKVLQHKLVPAVMAAAAAAASADTAGGVSAAAYNKACQQLLLAVCSSSGVSTVNDVEQRDSSKVSEALALACRLQPHILHACASTGVLAIAAAVAGVLLPRHNQACSYELRHVQLTHGWSYCIFPVPCRRW